MSPIIIFHVADPGCRFWKRNICMKCNYQPLEFSSSNQEDGVIHKWSSSVFQLKHDMKEHRGWYKNLQVYACTDDLAKMAMIQDS